MLSLSRTVPLFIFGFTCLCFFSCEKESRKTKTIEIDTAKPESERNPPAPKGAGAKPLPDGKEQNTPPAATSNEPDPSEIDKTPEEVNPPQSNDDAGSKPPTADQDNVSCPEGSVAAIADLRECCTEQGFGKSCTGPCWKSGVPEELKKRCPTEIAPIKDCSQSPPQSDTKSWCNFHHNRRYCGVSDSEWLAQCQ